MTVFFDDRSVWVARAEQGGYWAKPAEGAPEPMSGDPSGGSLAVQRLFRHAGLDAGRLDAGDWNPLGDWIEPGMKVLVKPNWVLHENGSGAGIDCLVTHASIIDAVVAYVIRTGASQVIVADAPLQSCNLPLLLERSGVTRLMERWSSAGWPVEVRDLRMVARQGRELRDQTCPSGRRPDEYVMFDLAGDSLLEPVSRQGAFRVTMYDPGALHRTHRKGRHQYQIAREAIDADVVVNLPKLKTHKKAGITGALKNMVGINGHKQFLPHHRKGGSTSGGDCYPGLKWTKRWAEGSLDFGNRSAHRLLRQVCSTSAGLALRVGKWAGGDENVEGAWYGNDTIWRTCLDLQAILHYGRSDGTMARVPQRQVITVTDAIVGGEGDGPLRPTPAALGVLTLSRNTAAADWVNALLLGLDAARIPLTREAFRLSGFRLADYEPEEILVHLPGESIPAGVLRERRPRQVVAPPGWEGQCEWTPQTEEAA